MSYFSLAYDFKWYDVATRFTWKFLAEATAVEEAKVASFEQGYSAGWDDAVAAQQGDQGRIRADLARNLQSLSFTFQDARSHVLQSIKPLILEMVNRLGYDWDNDFDRRLWVVSVPPAAS